MADFSGVLHVHSSFSDGAMSVAEIADWAIAAQLDFVVVTDHSESLPPDRRSELFEECERLSRRVLLVPAVEFAHSGRHVIAMGPRECLISLTDEEAVRSPEMVRERGGMTIWAHPALTYALSLRDGVEADYDGWETWNLKVDGDLPNLPVISLLGRLARLRPIHSFAGSDLHAAPASGGGPRLAVTADADELSANALLDSLRRGEFRVECSRGSDPQAQVRPTAWDRTRSSLRHRRTRVACVVRYIAHRMKTLLRG